MNFEVFSLGTGGMMPLPGRFLTSALLRREGEIFLFDCGEGTQVSLKKLNLKWKKINAIFISHMHADHVTGLPGLLMLSSQVDRDDPLYIFGPERLKEYVEENRRILDMYINYEIRVIAVKEGVVYETEDYKVSAFKLDHTKECFGYSFVENDRPGEFNTEKAKELKVAMGPKWGMLQRGENVINEDGKVITPKEVLGDKRKGRKFSFITDTAYFPEIASFVMHSDLLLIEGMFSSALKEDAREKKHMTMTEAARVAKDAEVKMMGLQHYSPRYTDRELREIVQEARDIYPETILTRDRQVFKIPLKD